MRRHAWIGAMACTATLVLITACTSSKKSNTADRALAPAGPSSAAAGTGAATPATSGTQPPTVPTRALVKTATLTVRVTNVNAQADHAIRIATAAGGDVLDDERSGSGTRASAQLTLEVPPNTLEAQLGRLAALGDQIDRKTSTDDVTQKVVDVTSRLASMRTSLDRVRTLYANANSIGDVIRLESELASREADLESLEAQQHDLDRQTARATITLQLLAKQAVATAAHKQHRGGVGRGFVGGWHAFTASVRWTVTAFGAVLPFLVIAIAAGAVVLWWRRRVTPGSPPAQR
jgi:hypothetical protein